MHLQKNPRLTNLVLVDPFARVVLREAARRLRRCGQDWTKQNTGRPVCGYATDVRLLAEAWPGHIEALHEPDYPEQRIIPMKYRPHRAAVLDYGALWAIDPAFSNFKGRGFDL